MHIYTQQTYHSYVHTLLQVGYCLFFNYGLLLGILIKFNENSRSPCPYAKANCIFLTQIFVKKKVGCKREYILIMKIIRRSDAIQNVENYNPEVNNGSALASVEYLFSCNIER